MATLSLPFIFISDKRALETVGDNSPLPLPSPPSYVCLWKCGGWVWVWMQAWGVQRITSGVILHLSPGSLLLFATVSQCLASWPSLLFVCLAGLLLTATGRYLVIQVKREGTGAEECGVRCYKVILLHASWLFAFLVGQVRLICKFLSFFFSHNLIAQSQNSPAFLQQAISPDLWK